MYISRVVIRNFRNFECLDFELGAGTTCLLGENNSGKTNLLFAIRLAVDANLPSHHRILDEQDLHRCPGLERPTQVVVSVEFRGYEDDVEQLALVGTWEVAPGVARLTYRFRPRQEVVEAIEQGERPGDQLGPEDYRWELCGGGEADPALVEWQDPMGQTIRFGDLQHFRVSTLPALRDVLALLRQRRSSPIRRLLELSDVLEAERDALVAVLAAANDEVANQPTIHATGARIRESFHRTAGPAYTMDLRLGMSDPSFHSIATSLNVLLSDGLMQDFEPYRNGLGLNNVLYVSMLLDYFDAWAESSGGAGSVLLVEEPEAHLHPLLQRVLYSVLAARDSQVLLSTHSTHITSQAPLESVVVLTRDDDGVCRAGVPSRIPDMTDDDIRDVERYLDATRSVLLFARRVLFVEGAAEWFLLPPLLSHVLGVDLDAEGIAIVPIFGKHFTPYVRLFGEGGLPKRCVVLADRDMTPADVGAEDDFLPDDLEQLADGERVGVFLGQTTFERELVLPGTLEMLESACADLGAPRLAQSLGDARTRNPNDVDWENLRERTLRTAKRFGKGRFAQVAAAHASTVTELPGYISNAVGWLREAN